MPTSLEASPAASHRISAVVTDINLSFGTEMYDQPGYVPNHVRWRRIKKELSLHMAESTAWLHLAETEESELTTDDLVITDIKVGKRRPRDSLESSWESRPGGIWLLRSNYTGDSHRAVTRVDVLFGVDAVDPRPQWTLSQTPLHLGAMPEIPVARLSVRHGAVNSGPVDPRPELRAGRDGKFKIAQISDTHMVTGTGVCKDAIDAHGQPLPPSEADPLTVGFIERVLDTEKPDLVVLTGDQIHHDIPDSQSALFKVIAPIIERSIPYAAVFGNHDDEGVYALSRSEQMAVLHSLPFSLCQPGPEQVDGIGNYYLQVFPQSASQAAVLTIYLLDSHGQIPSKVKDPDYDWIKQSQIDWFLDTSQELRQAREEICQQSPHMSLAFMHIPFPELGRYATKATPQALATSARGSVMEVAADSEGTAHTMGSDIIGEHGFGNSMRVPGA
ncbi:hypothetical protein INS49_011037 [Diaporthe citri]|uniref:uncharacterized protein n=1 Tax=Diaporthe citri TaxID=83186 RepID=UPI001C8242A5|nr:uncharacterized protein INS49_011037 [Diaporthe citri]KAG6359982.1 hypothetical protein INS49_011037 [Diaporthe citri]